jgi:hypothetical protein
VREVLTFWLAVAVTGVAGWLALLAVVYGLAKAVGVLA